MNHTSFAFVELTLLSAAPSRCTNPMTSQMRVQASSALTLCPPSATAPAPRLPYHDKNILLMLFSARTSLRHVGHFLKPFLKVSRMHS